MKNINNIPSLLFLNKLFKPIKQTEAYINGLIDEEGHLLKKPNTEYEKTICNNFDIFIFRLRRLLGEARLAFLKGNILTENIVSESKFNVDKYEKEVIICNKLKSIFESLKNVEKEAYTYGFSKNDMEVFITETILNE